MLISYSIWFFGLVFFSPWEKIHHVNEAIIAEKLTFCVSPVQSVKPF